MFISSIKVKGERDSTGRPFRPKEAPTPIDPYGTSKLEAEDGIRVIAKESGMEIVVIRSVLVYGPGVKAEALSMMRWLYTGTPLPFGAIHDGRGLVALGKLVDLIVRCMNHPKAANRPFLSATVKISPPRCYSGELPRPRADLRDSFPFDRGYWRRLVAHQAKEMSHGGDAVHSRSTFPPRGRAWLVSPTRRRRCVKANSASLPGTLEYVAALGAERLFVRSETN